MSSEVRSRGATRARRKRTAYRFAFAGVLGALLVVGATAGALGLLQGVRVTAVQFDPDAAVTSSGSRLILTTNQSLQPVDAAQVSVSPDAEFTVSSAGRSIGVRFALPLADETAYTVTVTGVQGNGSDRAATLTYDFETPALEVYVMRRTDNGDTVYRTGLDGTEAVPVFTHAHIEDFRETSSALVMSVRTDDDTPALIVTDLDGQNPRELRLPGDGRGTVHELRSADRGDLIGYTYTDVDMARADARESVLFTASLLPAAADADPTEILVGDEPVSAAGWGFVPDTDSILVLSFEGRLLLTSPDGASVVDLGDAASIDGIARGTASAIVLRADGRYVIDLRDGTATPMGETAGSAGYLGDVVPVPGGGTLQQFTTTTETSILSVASDGTAKAVFTAGSGDALLQTCVAPSGRYAAFLVQPDAANNPYRTGYDLPVPTTVETHIVNLKDGSRTKPLEAFAISWCQGPIG